MQLDAHHNPLRHAPLPCLSEMLRRIKEISGVRVGNNRTCLSMKTYILAGNLNTESHQNARQHFVLTGSIVS